MKRKENGNSRILKEGIIRSIANAIIYAQLAVSDTLAKWERKRTLLQKKALFILFIVSGGGYCGYVLGDALFRPDTQADPRGVISVQQHEPLAIPKPETEKTDTAGKPDFKTKKQQ